MHEQTGGNSLLGYKMWLLHKMIRGVCPQPFPTVVDDLVLLVCTVLKKQQKSYKTVILYTI